MLIFIKLKIFAFPYSFTKAKLIINNAYKNSKQWGGEMTLRSYRNLEIISLL